MAHLNVLTEPASVEEHFGGYSVYWQVQASSMVGLTGTMAICQMLTNSLEMLELFEKGDNAIVDMLVSDIYGADYFRLGLKNNTIASSSGKVFRKGGVERRKFSSEDISKSLLYAISNNIGQIA